MVRGTLGVLLVLTLVILQLSLILAFKPSSQRRGTTSGWKQAAQSSKSRLEVAQSSVPDEGQLQKIFGVVSKAVQYTTSDPLRFRYAAATAARFGFFLTQGIGISLSGIDADRSDQNQQSRRRRFGDAARLTSRIRISCLMSKLSC